MKLKKFGQGDIPMMRRSRKVWSRLISAALLLQLLAFPTSGIAGSQAPPADDGDWAQWRGGPARTGESDSDLTPSLRVRWKAEVWPSDVTPALVSGDRVLVTDRGGRQIHSLDAATGNIVWSRATDLAAWTMANPPALAGGKVLYADQDGTLYGLDAHTGAQLWSVPFLLTGNSGRFTVAGGRIFMPTGYDLYALDLDGKQVWHTGAWGHTTAVGDGKLFLVDWDSATALDAATGRAIWSTGRGSQVGGTDAVYADGVLLVVWPAGRNATVQQDGRIVAVNAATGERLWEASGAGGLPAVHDGVVYLPRGDSVIARYRLADGTYLGAFSPGPLPADTTQPVIAGDYLWLSALKAVDLRTGEATEAYRPENPAQLAWPSNPVVGGGLALVAEGPFLVALEPTGLPPARGQMVSIPAEPSGAAPAGKAEAGPEDWVTELGPATHSSMGESLLSALLREAWRTEGVTLAGGSRPVVAGGRIFVREVGSDGAAPVSALDAGTGKRLWTAHPGPYGPGLLYYRDTVYAGGPGGMVYALNAADGRPRWAIQIDQPTLLGLAAGDGRIYATGEGWYQGARALDPDTGRLLWSTNQTTAGAPAVVQSVLYMSGRDLAAVALDAATGEPLWSQPGCRDCMSAFSTTLVDAGLVIQVGAGGVVRALDRATGKPLWRRGGATGMPVSMDGVLYIPTADHTEIVLPQSGTLLRTLPATGPMVGVSGYLFGKGISVADLGAGTTAALGSGDLQPLAVAGNQLVAGGPGGTLAVYESVSRPPVAAVIRGTVVGEGGQPITGAVAIRVGGRRVFTNPNDGTFAVRVRPGSYTLEAEATHWLPGRLPLTLTAGQEATVAIPLLPEPKGRARGTIANAARQPLAGARVTVAGELLPAVVTDGSGAYGFDLFPGVYTMRVEAPGHQVAYRTVTVTSGGETVLGITLKEGPAGSCETARCSADRSGNSSASLRFPLTHEWTAVNVSVYSNLVIGRGMLFYASDDDRLAAFDLATGTERWSRPAPSYWGESGSAYGDGRLYAGGDGVMQALEPETGTVLWEYRHGSGRHGLPVYAEGRVYFVTYLDQNWLQALDAGTGKLLWRQQVKGGSDLAVGGGRIYLSSGDGLQVFARETGALLWESSIPKAEGWRIQEFAYSGEVLLMARGTGHKLLALNAATGERLWEAPGGIPAVREGVVYTYDDGLAALDLHTGALLWRAALPLWQGASPDLLLAGKYLVLGGAVVVDLEARQAVWRLDGGWDPTVGEGFLLLRRSGPEVVIYRGDS